MIPTWQEADRIAALVTTLREAGAFEVIVCDGGSPDGTASAARAAGAEILETTRGRGTQLAAGTAASRGEAIWLLHADSVLFGVPWARMEALLAAGRAGAFRLRIQAPGAVLRLIEWGTRLRVAMTGIPYGDQGLFLRRIDLARAGGVPAWPLMEDIGLVQALTRVGVRVRVLDHPLGTDARRWLREGPLRRTLRNWSLALRYHWFGAEPEALALAYRPEPDPSVRT